MESHVAVLALVVCVVLAGCGGPGAENETTTESNADGTRAVELPSNETVAEPETTRGTTAASRAATFEMVYPSPAGTEEDGGIYSSLSPDSSDPYR
jgi:hypothetical protein